MLEVAEEVRDRTLNEATTNAVHFRRRREEDDDSNTAVRQHTTVSCRDRSENQMSPSGE